MDQDKLKTAQHIITMMPHAKRLGMHVQEVAPARAKITMPYSEALIGDPVSKVIHGGAISALMDTTAGTAVALHPKADVQTVTLNLRIDYMRSAYPGQTITAHAECFHITQTAAFVRATAHDEDTQNPIATATGVFTVMDKENASA